MIYYLWDDFLTFTTCISSVDFILWIMWSDLYPTLTWILSTNAMFSFCWGEKSIRKKLNFWSTLLKVCLFSLIHHTVWDRYEIVNIIFLVLFRYINCRDMFVTVWSSSIMSDVFKKFVHIYYLRCQLSSFTNCPDKFIGQTIFSSVCVPESLGGCSGKYTPGLREQHCHHLL